MSAESNDIENNFTDSIEKQFKEIDTRGAWAVFYQRIRHESNDYHYSYDASKKPENKNLNRYRDVNPYDHSRVVLKRGTSEGLSDYINASFVRMPNARRQYILAQGPLPNTTEHFWLMIWEQNCKAVIMLNRVIEKNQIKCHSYWPTGSGNDKELLLPSVKLKVEFVSETNMSYYSTRVFRLTDLETGDCREVHHFHYTTWPDFGVPQSPLAFLHFLMVVRQSGALDENVGPPVVHCSAGIGRSGTFCLVDTCLVHLLEDKCSVNVRDVLMEMRRHRMGLIQTPDQLRFSYLAILEGARSLENGDIKLEMLNANLVQDQPEDDEGPPPQPPPRGESLLVRAAQQILEESSNSNHVNPSPMAWPEILPELPPDRPLPFEPDTAPQGKLTLSESGSDDEPINSTLPNANNSEAHEVRRRKRAERRERTTEQVKDIKRKQREAEEWQERKRSKKKRRD